ncbi:MAG TPA: T9SS type A sorting domain-containing protein, partial [Candidatus Kapabacteria bacterium]
ENSDGKVNNNSTIRMHIIPARPNNGKTVTLNFNRNLPPPPPSPHINMEQMENSLDMSNLIPIRVVNNKNPDHPNELIFWYDATPEVEAALPPFPASVPPVAMKGISVSVYPNPTNGLAKVHYELANAPKAHFTMRNLLGQVVMDGGWSADATGDEALDLSQLPAGVYLLVTTTENGDRDVERVVVAK